MTNENIQSAIHNYASENDLSIGIIDGYDESIIGITDTGSLIYDYTLMVDELMRTDGMTEDEAIEWIDYNTIRSLPYCPGEKPIVLEYAFDEDDEIELDLPKIRITVNQLLLYY